MTEAEYVLATNLQKMRSVCDLFNDMLPSLGLEGSSLRRMKRQAIDARISLFKAVGDLDEH